jgi:hypothetical protein
MSFKLLSDEQDKDHNVKFPHTLLITAVKAFIYLLMISDRIMFVSSTLIKKTILDCSNEILSH